MTKPWIVAFHADCNDGFCAAWVAKRAMGDNAILVPVKYGSPVIGQLPLGDYSQIIFLDWCPQPSDMLALCQRFDWIEIIDHHEQPDEDFLDFWGADDCPLKEHREKVAIYFDPSMSGARLAWAHWFPHTEPPLLVRYVEDRDLWKKELSHTNEVTAWLSCYPKDFAVWNDLASLLVDKDQRDYPSPRVLAVGQCLLWNRSQRIQRHIQQARLCMTPEGSMSRWPLGPIPVVNCTDMEIISDLGNELASGNPYSVTYREEQGRIIYSLRSTETGANVAEIAKQFGGGGHTHAAGFTV